MAGRTITKINAIPKLATMKAAAKAYMKVAAYARVSTDHEEQQTSLEAQIDYYKQKIAEHPGWEFVEIYADEGISGLSTVRREAFNRMIADCEAGKIDLILTKSISRFARNTVDSITIIRKLKEKGIGIFFEKESVFTLDSKGEFLLTLMSSLAQEESRSISENVTWGHRKRFADGKSSLAYSRFLGYDKGPNKYEMVVNEEQAVIVKKIFYMFLQGYTPHSIAKLLTADGIPTPAGLKKWNQQTVRRMLSNEKYKGDALLQKEFTVDFLQKKHKKNEGEVPQYYVEDDHEAIIAPWLFDYVQEKLVERNEGTDKNVRYSGVSIWSSKIVCGKCGGKFGPKPWHSDTFNDVVWQCRNRFNKENKCITHNIYEKLLIYLLHDAAKELAIKRGVLAAVTNIAAEVTGRADISDWGAAFRDRDTWTLASDDEDIAVVIKEAVVMPDGRLDITLIDGKKTARRIPRYSPRMHPDFDESEIKIHRDGKSPGCEPQQPKRDENCEMVFCRNCGCEIRQIPKQKRRIFCCRNCMIQ